MDEQQFSEQAFDRAAADLRRVIHAVAERYLIRRQPLTWRLIHDIEAEALADLGLESRHGADLNWSRTSTAHPVPFIVWLVFDVYGIAARPEARSAAMTRDTLHKR